MLKIAAKAIMNWMGMDHLQMLPWADRHVRHYHTFEITELIGN